jgi:putative transcriptional regulator
MKKGHDSILSVVHETAKDLRNAGIMDEITMREFDALCLPPVKKYQAQEIRQIRLYRKNRPCQLLPTFMSQTH